MVSERGRSAPPYASGGAAGVKKTDQCRQEVFVGGQIEEVSTRRAQFGVDRGCLGLRLDLESLSYAAIAGVDEDLPAGLWILKGNEADIGDRIFARVTQPNGDDLMAVAKASERRLPTRRCEEVRDDDHERPATDHPAGVIESAGQVGGSAASVAGRTLDRRGKLEQVVPPSAGGDDRADTVGEGDEAQSVTAAGQERPSDRCEVGSLVALEHPGGSPVHRCAQIDQQPDVERSLDKSLTDMRPVGPGGDIPVDVADVVARLVLANFGQFEARPALR